MLDIYTYVADNNPSECRRLLKKHGYRPTSNPRSASELGLALKELVAHEGESALYDIVALHPDRDVIVEMFGDGNQKCKCDDRIARLENHFMNFNGSGAKASESQNNIMFLGAALLIAAAIITRK